jgi:membrane dipeptidase
MSIARAYPANPRRVLFLILILAVLGVLFFALPSLLESHFNKVLPSPPPAASQRVQELHSSLLIADLHADSLLWGRNLLKESTRGHVDVPRLIKGNVALQVFLLPTKTP